MGNTKSPPPCALGLCLFHKLDFLYLALQLLTSHKLKQHQCCPSCLQSGREVSTQMCWQRWARTLGEVWGEDCFENMQAYRYSGDRMKHRIYRSITMTKDRGSMYSMASCDHGYCHKKHYSQKRAGSGLNPPEVSRRQANSRCRSRLQP